MASRDLTWSISYLLVVNDTIGDGAVRASQTANRVGRFWRVTGTKTKDTNFKHVCSKWAGSPGAGRSI